MAPVPVRQGEGKSMYRVVVAAVLGLAISVPATAAAGPLDRSLDGSGNNVLHSDWGQAGTQYLRIAPANYADGVAQMVAGPSPRHVSNAIFNDVGQNIFSENGISQRSEEHTSELQSPDHLVCRLLLEKKKEIRR